MSVLVVATSVAIVLFVLRTADDTAANCAYRATNSSAFEAASALVADDGTSARTYQAAENSTFLRLSCASAAGTASAEEDEAKDCECENETFHSEELLFVVKVAGCDASECQRVQSKGHCKRSNRSNTGNNQLSA